MDISSVWYMPDGVTPAEVVKPFIEAGCDAHVGNDLYIYLYSSEALVMAMMLGYRQHRTESLPDS